MRTEPTGTAKLEEAGRAARRDFFQELAGEDAADYKILVTRESPISESVQRSLRFKPWGTLPYSVHPPLLALPSRPSFRPDPSRVALGADRAGRCFLALSTAGALGPLPKRWDKDSRGPDSRPSA